MKKILVILLFSPLFFVSCDKDTPEKPAKNNDSLLVGKVWRADRITSAQAGTIYHYSRGGQNNNFDYSGYTLEFNADGTGIYMAGTRQYSFTWEFTNSEKSELSYIIANYSNGEPTAGVNLEVKLENIKLTENSFKYAELYTNQDGTGAVSSVYRFSN